MKTRQSYNRANS